MSTQHTPETARMPDDLADAITAAFKKAQACSMFTRFEGRNVYEGSVEMWQAHEAKFDAWRAANPKSAA